MGNIEGSPDVPSHRQKVHTQVKEGVVIGLNAIVLHGHSVIELGTCVHLKLARSNIHNMGDAQLGESALVPGCIPGGRARGWGWWELGGGGSSPWVSSDWAGTCPLPSSGTPAKGRLELVNWPGVMGLL